MDISTSPLTQNLVPAAGFREWIYFTLGVIKPSVSPRIPICPRRHRIFLLHGHTGCQSSAQVGLSISYSPFLPLIIPVVYIPHTLTLAFPFEAETLPYQHHAAPNSRSLSPPAPSEGRFRLGLGLAQLRRLQPGLV